MFNLDSNSLILIIVLAVLALQSALNWFTPQNRFLFLFNMALFFQGISIFLLRSKIPNHFGIILMITSGYYILNAIRENDNLISSGRNLSSQFIFTLKRKIPVKNLFPYVGLIIIFTTIVRNWYLEDIFGQNDKLLIISAITWIAYNYVPLGFDRERDFIFLFSNLLIATFVLPAFIFNSLVSSDTPDYGNKLIYILLVSPLENLLHLTGYEVWDHEGLVTDFEGRQSGVLSYKMKDGSTSSVFITEMCSGMYSIYIFTSAFAAYILTEYKQWNVNVTLLLLVGLLTAYLANLLRMYLIILVGIYWGAEKLYWAHSNFGWLIFLFWIGIFWNLIIPNIMVSKSD